MTQYHQHETTQSAPARLFALGPAATKVALLAFFAMLLLLYLAQSTQGATRQYEVRNLEEEITTLKQDREQLELESVRLQSLNEVVPDAPETTENKEAPKPEGDQLVPAQHINALVQPNKTVVSR